MISFFATKSVSQKTLTIAPKSHVLFTSANTQPSLFTQSILLFATFIPFLRKYSIAFFISPSDSNNAFLQLINPAPVILRKSFISFIDTDISLLFIFQIFQLFC